MLIVFLKNSQKNNPGQKNTGACSLMNEGHVDKSL